MGEESYSISAWKEKDNSKLLEKLFDVEKGFKETEVLRDIEELYDIFGQLEKMRGMELTEEQVEEYSDTGQNPLRMEVTGEKDYLVYNRKDLQKVRSILDPYRKYMESTTEAYKDFEDARDKHYRIFDKEDLFEAEIEVERENNVINLDISLSDQGLSEDGVELYRSVLEEKGYNTD